jgi:hypothetical protein
MGALTGSLSLPRRRAMEKPWTEEVYAVSQELTAAGLAVDCSMALCVKYYGYFGKGADPKKTAETLLANGAEVGMLAWYVLPWEREPEPSPERRKIILPKIPK